MSEDVLTEARSLLEGLPSWGDGPNWADPSGACIPVAKPTLRRVLEYIVDGYGETRVIERIRDWADDAEMVKAMTHTWTPEQLRELADRLERIDERERARVSSSPQR